MNVDVLILSGLYDFSTDLVVQELEHRCVPYLRLNKESFSDYCLTLDIHRNVLEVEVNGFHYIVDESVQSIYYRQPVFLRNTPGDPLSVEEQLCRSQWMGFLRSLLVFDKAKWINPPEATYVSETKAYQLKIASGIGFKIPSTLIGNDVKKFNGFGDKVIIKSLDTVLLRDRDECLFTYSTISNVEELSDGEVRSAPLTIQEYIYPKIDIRVTVIGGKVYAVKILSNGEGIDDDWRVTASDKLEYIDFDLPVPIKSLCLKLVGDLGLTFGAIDFIQRNDEFVFIEINPTGEWGWLVEDHRRMDLDIASLLCGDVDVDKIVA